MAKLLPFAAEAKRGRGSQSWTCLCQRRLQQAWNGLQRIAAGAKVPGERISVLRFPCPRPSADEKRDGRATFYLHAGRNYRHELHESLRMGRPESQSEQASGKVFRRFCPCRELGDARVLYSPPTGIGRLQVAQGHGTRRVPAGTKNGGIRDR